MWPAIGCTICAMHGRIRSFFWAESSGSPPYMTVLPRTRTGGSWNRSAGHLAPQLTVLRWPWGALHTSTTKAAQCPCPGLVLRYSMPTSPRESLVIQWHYNRDVLLAGSCLYTIGSKSMQLACPLPRAGAGLATHFLTHPQLIHPESKPGPRLSISYNKISTIPDKIASIAQLGKSNP
jgi:hypothetical protein